jgi:hypothetical protein
MRIHAGKFCFGLAVVTFVLAALPAAGCSDSAEALRLLGLQPFRTFSDGTTAPPSTPTGGAGGFFSGASRENIDPCTERQDRKFVRISMRNLARDDFVHYFLVMIAFVNSDTYPNGAVCADDIDLYTSFGYEEVAEGVDREFGNYCVSGPALIYFHENGQFQSAGTGGSSLASAIGPAQGTSATFDNFFTSAGFLAPVPNSILFYNPGFGEGAALKISRNNLQPCDVVVGLSADSDCRQDAFYYVDESDRLSGSSALGTSSGRRVPNEIQGTGCETGGFDDIIGTSASQVLAPSGATASNARDNEFLRGGRIEYAFLREDVNPPFPQLVWRVSDASGSVAQDFDPRADVP